MKNEFNLKTDKEISKFMCECLSIYFYVQIDTVQSGIMRGVSNST